MKKIYFKFLMVGLLCMGGFEALQAQEISTLQFMKGMPQSTLLNPALHNDSSKVVIGLPGLSGLSFDANSGFAVSDFMPKELLSDSLEIDIEGFHNKLKPVNNVVQDMSLPLLFFGLRVKSSFFSLGITEKQVARFSFDKRVVTFIKDGNEPYVGQNFDLGNININAMHYREFAFGYSREVMKNKLTVGLKAKFLYGKSAIQSEYMNLKVETAADTSYINLNYKMRLNSSAPVGVEFDEQNKFDSINTENMDPVDYMLQSGNKGMAFDLGAVYKLNAHITLYGSLIDIGKISFKKDLHNLDYSTSYKWEGIDLSNSVDKSQDDYVNPSDQMDKEMDKFTESFQPKRSDFTSEEFSVTVPMKLYLGGTYALNDKLNFGLLERLYKSGDFSQNSVTLSANTMVGNFLSLTGSYSAIGNAYDNLGVGMAVRLGFFQLYAVGDNVLAIAHVARVQTANARIGVNFLFGRKHAVRVQ